MAKPDAGLEVALDQRRRKLDTARMVLAQREMLIQQQVALVASTQDRVRVLLEQMDAEQHPAEGETLPVAMLGDLERLVQRSDFELEVQCAHLESVRAQADVARGDVAAAHQNVRALELVLEARAAERMEKIRRAELRLADETAAQVHARNQVAR
jgi:hypothetical protein